MLVMQEPIRVGVVGFGLAGKVFSHPRDSGNAGAGAGQRGGAQRRRAAKLYPRIRVARSVEEMLCDVGIQLVAIATPSYSHYELAQQCLREQRHVVIDKAVRAEVKEARS